MKLSVSIYSFSQYISSGKLCEMDCISKAKELGFEAIEFLELEREVTDATIQRAYALKKECDRVGITVSSYAISADLYSRENEVARIKRHVDIAEILGAKLMRHDVANSPEPRLWKSYEVVANEVASLVYEISEYAREKGIKTMTENHGFFSQDSDRVEYLISQVANDNFGALIDIGNFLCADEAAEIAVGRCAPYAFCVHAKDFIVKSGEKYDPGEGFFKSRAGNYLRGTIIGHGNVPVVQCLKILKDIGYTGYVVIEFEGMEDCIEAIKIGKNNLENYLRII